MSEFTEQEVVALKAMAASEFLRIQIDWAGVARDQFREDMKAWLAIPRWRRWLIDKPDPLHYKL